MPVLIILEFSLKFLEIEKHVLGFSRRSKVQFHAIVVAILETCLSLRHVVVEITIEVRKLFVIKLARGHAV